MINGFLIFILTVIFLEYILGLIIEILEVRSLSTRLPDEFAGVYDVERYARSIEYNRERSKFSAFVSTFTFIVTAAFILAGGFNYIDLTARSAGFGTIPTALFFAGILGGASFIMNLPFSIYSTFVIEEKFGFNKTTPLTFAADLVKEIILSAVIGGIIFAAIVWFFETAGSLAWLYAWGAAAVFSLLLQFIAPAVILPLFNKFTPVSDGPLKERIEKYAADNSFKIKGIYLMDGSKRSTKANAFFTGWGKFRRIVFYDTLLDTMDEDEILAVLAHEMGHYKMKHLLKMSAASLVITALIFFMIPLFMNSRELFDAFGMEYMSVYAGIIFFMFIYSPVNFLLSIGANAVSRTHEFAADRYSSAAGFAEPMIRALKKLSAKNMSNLTPHPFDVFLNYSHPPVLQRIARIRKGDV
jgi:STE24 endopeptidase